MNSLSRWWHRSEREHELRLVQLWTANTLEASDPETEPHVSELAAAAKADLKDTVKYLGPEEIERAITYVVEQTAYDRRVRRNLRKHIKHRRASAGGSQ